MSLSKRERVLICILLIVSVFGFYTSYLFIPRFEKLKSNRSFLEEQKLLLESLKKQDDNELKQKISDMEKVVENLEAKIPDTMDIPNLYMTFLTLQNKNKIKFEALAFSEPQKVQNDLSLYQTDIDMALTGSERNIEKFFNSLYEIDRELVISEINYTRVEDNIIRANYKIHAYGRNP